MGSIYLTELANWLRDAGLNVIENSGWQKRARSSGGYDAMPLCVMWHHTASGASWDGKRDADYCATGDPNSPVSNLYIDRSGTVWVLAAGATNTNGKGGPQSFSRGTVPIDSMNTRAVGVEMGNNGIGEAWPEAQVNSMFTVSNVVNSKLGNQPTDCCTHWVWAPTRKIDPATAGAVIGPWKPRSATSSGTWDLGDIRAECTRRAQQGPSPRPPVPNPDDGDAMAYACEGIWVMGDDYSVPYGMTVAVYSGGYKTWIPDEATLAKKQDLCAINGVDNSVRVQTDPNMWRAFGPLLGPIPDGYDSFGLPC